MSEVEEHGSEPVVNLVQSALFVRRLQDRLQNTEAVRIMLCSAEAPLKIHTTSQRFGHTFSFNGFSLSYDHFH